MSEHVAIEGFEPFPKMARLSRPCVVTEKIDGTNAQVVVEHQSIASPNVPWLAQNLDGFAIAAGSRTRWITEKDDNYGFAKWVAKNAAELVKLGPGRHYGEWWGAGIQCGYGLTGADKRFSLFNTNRWGVCRDVAKYPGDAPSCCHVVPVLYAGMFSTDMIETIVTDLRTNGSVAAPGFMQPEGVVVFHTAQGFLFKKTLVKDESPKGLHV